ncbi:unnamed protein product [Lactuca virosa]|uniref:USP domain-containing protein n=1 Tax=Lactuca virosa TaxID=75947 RepID=A0AAU9LP78_9ASTR|nr:unnamed protein product [Lactuca virosa]
MQATDRTKMDIDVLKSGYIALFGNSEQNSSITSCLKNFSSTETLKAEDKFFYDKCCSLQEAQKRMKIKKQPHILMIHLKRFKYMEQLRRYKKLSYRVVFPLELKLTNTMEDVDCEYSLFAMVVHVGSGPTMCIITFWVRPRSMQATLDGPVLFTWRLLVVPSPPPIYNLKPSSTHGGFTVFTVRYLINLAESTSLLLSIGVDGYPLCHRSGRSVVTYVEKSDICLRRQRERWWKTLVDWCSSLSKSVCHPLQILPLLPPLVPPSELTKKIKENESDGN